MQGRILFPNFVNYAGTEAKKGYLNMEMARMIRDGDFSLTEVMGQQSAIVDMCGEIVFNLQLDPNIGVQMEGYGTAQEIDDHRVKLQSIRWDEEAKDYVDCDRPITYKHGMKTVGYMNLGEHILRDSSHVIKEDNIKTLPSSCTVTLRQAWIALGEKGQYVRQAIRADAQHNKWQIREVPANEQPADTSKRKAAKDSPAQVQAQ